MTSELALIEIAATLEAEDIPVPNALRRGLELFDVADAHQVAPTGALLSMTDAQARTRLTDLAVRAHAPGGRGEAPGMQSGRRAFDRQLLAEIRDAVVPELESIIVDLRPRFEALAAPLVTAATEYGFTWATSSDDIVNLADEAASAAWRAARDAIAGLRSMVALRELLSESFDLSPTAREAYDYLRFRGMSGRGAAVVLDGPATDVSIAFAAGENWALDGTYYVDGDLRADIDWLALAVGGLQLNTPAEVRTKFEDRRRIR